MSGHIAQRIPVLRYGLPALLLLFCSACFCACRAEADSAKAFSEQFERGTKPAYAAAVIQLASGPWRLEGALIGSSRDDVKKGKAALRLAAGGSATMLFDIRAEESVLQLRYATYGKDRSSALSCWYSKDGGVQWLPAGAAVSARSSPDVASFPIPAGLALRFSIRNSGRGRVNVDDIALHANTAILSIDNLAAAPPAAREASGQESVPAGRDDNMALGNPSAATPDPANRNNYLLTHPQYSLSYNNDKGIANWVSWHLSNAWRGPAPRCNCFFGDNELPEGHYRATTSAYIGTGFDRGHLCPSEDRTASPEDNAATFLMSNIAPQAPMLNQQPWARLEEYARRLADEGFELYIIAGHYGQGGAGAKGGADAIAQGRISVPARYWKIMLVLPAGDNDLQRISKSTRVIAVDMPNNQSPEAQDWRQYLTTVQRIEKATRYNFFNKLPPEVGAALKDKVDGG